MELVESKRTYVREGEEEGVGFGGLRGEAGAVGKSVGARLGGVGSAGFGVWLRDLGRGQLAGSRSAAA